MASISLIQSGVSPRAWHNVVPVGDGTAWACGGQVPASYATPPVWGVYQSCQRFDLTTGAVLATGSFPYGYAHSPAFLIGGRLCVPGGMGQLGTQFQALDATQEIDVAGNQNWQHSLSNGGHGPGYDLNAVQLDEISIVYCGGHGYNTTTKRSWSRFDTEAVDFACMPPVATAHPGLVQSRVYHNMHRVDATHAVAALGLNYGDADTERRNLATVEILGTDGSARIIATVAQARRYGPSEFYSDTDELYLLGGTRESAFGRPVACDDVDCVNVATGVVTPMPPLQLPRYHAQSCRVQMCGKNYVAMVGGQSAAGTPVVPIELYCTDDGTSTLIGNMPFNSVDHGRISVAAGSKMIALGGEDCAANAVASLNGFAPMAVIDFGAGSVCSRA